MIGHLWQPIKIHLVDSSDDLFVFAFSCLVQVMMKSLFIAVFLLATLGFVASSELSCPKVFDGLTNGHFDLATQFSVSEISANWVPLANTPILGYEWAIISEDKINNLSRSFFVRLFFSVF